MKAMPPVGSPVMNRTTAPRDTSTDAMPKKIADTDSRKLNTAVITVRASAKGMAMILRISLM
jgi:hypothetical protein